MKTKEIRDLIDFISQTGLNEVNIETEELKLSVKRQPDAARAYVETTPAIESGHSTQKQIELPENKSGAESAPSDNNSKYLEVKSPMIGTFYRSPNPDSPAFVSVGDKIESGSPVCVIEAMKLFNEIESEVSGTIVKVLVENASPVEYDQALFLVDPS